MTHMTRVLKYNPLDPRDRTEPRLNTQLRNLVVPPIKKQRIDIDILCLLRPIPILEIAIDHDLRWPLHGVVRSGVVLQVDERLLNWLGQRIDSTDVLLIEKRAGSFVLGRFEVAGPITFLQDLLDIRG